MYIYNEKTFQKLFEINLEKIIDKYEEEKAKLEYQNEIKRITDKMAIDLMKSFYSKNKNSIKEIDNDIILLGRDIYLIEFILYDKS